MIRSLSITAIVENTAGTFDLLGEWGLSLWIEADQHHIVYDAGQGRSLRENAQRLGIDLSAAQALVLSHGHSDHSGGIAELIASGFRGRLYAHPAALTPKFQREKNSLVREKGLSASCQQALRSHSVEVINTSAATEIAPGIVVSGAIPRNTDFETTGNSYFLDQACTRQDSLVDDQALFIESAEGWVVITGCGHSGMINTLAYARHLTGSPRIFAVVGGMHLLHASKERIRRTAEEMHRSGVRLLAPGHCTGSEATAYLQNHFPADVKVLQAGTTIRFAP
jgi:7,8-dihydropterin-6-yl-methyl-4-(beta-D-ribofuranosyl)aminobenzene 5'-phosphate synthase